MEVRDMDEEDKAPSSEGEGDDLEDRMEEDYQKNDMLDNYENIGIDDDLQNELGREDRLQAERLLNERDRKNIRSDKRMPTALMMDDEMSEDREL
jgi:hypothetical protein